MNELSLLELFAQATLIVKIVVVILIIASIIAGSLLLSVICITEAENFNDEFEHYFGIQRCDKLLKHQFKGSI